MEKMFLILMIFFLAEVIVLLPIVFYYILQGVKESEELNSTNCSNTSV